MSFASNIHEFPKDNTNIKYEVIDNYIVANGKKLILPDDLFVKSSNTRILNQIKNELNSFYRFPPEKFSSIEIYITEKKILIKDKFLSNDYDVDFHLVHSNILKNNKYDPGLALLNFLDEFNIEHPHYVKDIVSHFDKENIVKEIKKIGGDYYKNHKKLKKVIFQEYLKFSNTEKACLYALCRETGEFMSAFLLVTDRCSPHEYAHDMFKSYYGDINPFKITDSPYDHASLVDQDIEVATTVRSYINNSFHKKDYYPYNLLEKGENQVIEFKETLRKSTGNKDIPGVVVESWVLKTLVGFANNNGGDLFIGVDDDGNITGIEKDGFKSNDDFLKHLKNIIKERIKPNFFQLSNGGVIKKINGKFFCHISCEKQTNNYKGFWLRDNKDKKKYKFYVRKGPSTEELKDYDAAEYVINRREN